jgi:DNA-directed RNA polymerase subunit E'/Rpb7
MYYYIYIMSSPTPKAVVSKPKPKIKTKKKERSVGIYMKNAITRKVHLSFNVIGENLKENIEKTLQKEIEGRCIDEGYIRPNSIVIVSYSAGVISGNTVTFNVLFECLVCRPVEGMRFRAVVKNVTKAGIRAEINEVKSPVVVFIARDLHYKSAQFSKLKEGDDINVRVIGIRYELNDEYISIIGELVEKKIRVAKIPKPKIIIEGKEV